MKIQSAVISGYVIYLRLKASVSQLAICDINECTDMQNPHHPGRLARQLDSAASHSHRQVGVEGLASETLICQPCLNGVAWRALASDQLIDSLHEII